VGWASMKSLMRPNPWARADTGPVAIIIRRLHTLLLEDGLRAAVQLDRAESRDVTDDQAESDRQDEERVVRPVSFL
jgi:hypothetical protein